MREIPFVGRLDVALACLLTIERHGEFARREPRRDEISADVMSLVDFLDVPPECLGDVAAFDDEIGRALSRLVRAGWVAERRVADAIAFSPGEVAADAIAWIRSRLVRESRLVAAFERLDGAITARVVSDYGAGDPSRRPSART
jgi:hypothetical protein